MPVSLGLGLPQMKQYDIGRDVAAVARAAEETGYESLWVFERILFPEPATQGLYGVPGLPWPDQYRSVADPLITLALAAGATGRARLGTSVLVAPLHMPFQLARSLARSTPRAADGWWRASGRAGPWTSTPPPRSPPSRSAARFWTSCSTCARPSGARIRSRTRAS